MVLEVVLFSVLLGIKRIVDAFWVFLMWFFGLMLIGWLTKPC